MAPISIIIDMPACTGCCDAVPCESVQCRSASGAGTGDATICGFEEYTSPSLPPKRYKKQTWFAEYTDCSWSYGVGSCTGAHGETYHASGAAGTFSGPIPVNCTYNSDCSATTTDGLDWYAGRIVPSDECLASPQTPTNFLDARACLTTLVPPPSIYAMTLTSAGPTGIGYNGSGICSDPGSSSRDIYIGSQAWSLSVEDTIFDAIDRNGYGSYGAWGACGDTNMSYISVRGSGDFTSTYAKAQARRCCTLEVDAAYTATLTTQKRITGSSDPFVAGPTVVVGFTATSTDECVEIDVPQIDQYEVQVVNLVVTKD